MSRLLRPPLVVVLLAAVAVAALLAVFSTRAQAPPEPAAEGESQPQANAQEEAATLTKAGAGGPGAAPAALAANFQDRLVTDNARGATALAFLPDGRLLVSDRTGRVLLRKPGQTGTTVALDISGDVCSNSERGLLGVAVDPNFQDNGFVYIYYTYKKFGSCPDKAPEQNNPVNRVSRFQTNAEPGPQGNVTIVRNTEDVLINNIPSPNGNHNAGDLHFGADDKLYVSVGDGACNYAPPNNCQPQNDASRYRNVLLAKILRINRDGTVPTDNPYADSPDGVRCGNGNGTNAAGGFAASPGKVCTETYAWGFRNPFRFAIDPDATGTAQNPTVNLRANDVGGARIEEVSQVRSGGDYGWNCREGTLPLNTESPCPGNEMIGPINQYSHGSGCSSITGGAFVPDDAGWPRFYDDAYLFADYVCNKIFSIQPNGSGGFARTTFANDLAAGGPVSLAFGPDGSLYYTTYAGGGQVRRIVFTNNQSPVAKISATPTDPDTGKTFGPAPLTVDFTGSAEDPEGDPIKYEWDFDYTNDTFTVDSEGANASHTYTETRAYTAALRVSDDRGNSDLVRKTIYAGNTAAPEPVIESPTAGRTFTVGEEVPLSGSATDDGPNVTLEWDVIRHHTAPNTHTHPYKMVSGTNGSFTAPAPEDLYSLNPEGNYVEVRLTATDSQGLSKSVSRAVRPETTEVRFGTTPAGLFVNVNGTRVRAPRTLLAWQGSDLNLYAPSQSRDGRRYVFSAWSDGRGNRHTVRVTDQPASYTARFRQR